MHNSRKKNVIALNSKKIKNEKPQTFLSDIFSNNSNQLCIVMLYANMIFNKLNKQSFCTFLAVTDMVRRRTQVSKYYCISTPEVVEKCCTYLYSCC